MTEAITPKALKPYIFHGVDIEWYEDRDNAIGECPFCGKDEKFGVNKETGQYQCFVCGAVGNVYTFLKWLWNESDAATKDYEELLADRKLIFAETLMRWGICRSVLLDEWLVPAYNENGKLSQLYRYVKTTDNTKLLATPTLAHQLFGGNLFDKTKSDVHVCEGPWDAMALWEVLGHGKSDDKGENFRPTANIDSSFLQFVNVVGVAGCNVWKSRWATLLKDCRVFLLYDNDHPRVHPRTNEQIAPAGYTGAMRVANAIKSTAESVYMLKWGEGGYTPDLPNGYDVRDYLTAVVGQRPVLRPLADRLRALENLLGKIVPINWQATNGSARGLRTDVPKEGGLATKKCEKYKTLSLAWRKALKWTDGLDHALTVMLASIASTKSIGDQLWIKVIGPAACGKSTLCEALSTNTEYVLAKSTIRGFHSGFRLEGGEEAQDSSLIALVRDKTLVIKDGDTLLQAPNLLQILSEARDIYDRTSRTHYRNAMSKDYNDVNMTWILCGTSSLRNIDASELGERFLDCVIMEGIDEDLEDEILIRVMHKAERNVNLEVEESQQEPALREAMALTGGYVGYLRENSGEKLAETIMSEEAKLQCLNLGKFVAYMRARPDKECNAHQEEDAGRELASRLVSQLVRMAKCLAFVLNDPEVSEAVMKRVKRVALDTSRGRTLEIAKSLLDVEGKPSNALAVELQYTEADVKKLLRFLRRIRVVKTYSDVSIEGVRGKPKWRLTNNFRRLMREIRIK